MQALIYKDYGDISQIQLTEQPLPKCGPSDVLIKVHAASINPIDWKLVRGILKILPNFMIPHPSLETPLKLGMDVSGVIEKKGDRVTDAFKVGDAVFAKGGIASTGSMAEYYVLSEDLLCKKPSNVTHVEASSFPLAGLTSYQALKLFQPKKGNKILILGGSGGTGSLGIQIAKAMGFYVATTCSERNTELVKTLGADEVIDYSKDHFADVLKGQQYDGIYDCVGGFDSWNRSGDVLKNGCHYVTIVGDHLPHQVKLTDLATAFYHTVSRNIGALFKLCPKYSLIGTVASFDDLTFLKTLVENEQLKPVIDSTFELSEFHEAFSKSVSSRARGKLVFEIQK